MADIRDRLKLLTYPCFLVVHAGERNFRTKYRSECAGVFARAIVNNADEAYCLVEQTKYQGHPNEIQLCGAVLVKDEDDSIRLEEFDG